VRLVTLPTQRQDCARSAYRARSARPPLIPLVLLNPVLPPEAEQRTVEVLHARLPLMNLAVLALRQSDPLALSRRNDPTARRSPCEYDDRFPAPRTH
jgi:hypothetical protein